MAAKTMRERRRESDENQSGKRIPIPIPDDLIWALLKRLPSKSIGRFRCLSKHWLSNLSDPKFINRHAIEAKENPNASQKLFCCVYETKSLYKLNTETYNDDFTYGKEFDIIHDAEKMELPTDEQPGSPPFGYRMVGSCNGLLCLQRQISHNGEMFFVLNPLTGESRQLFYFNDRYAQTNLGFGYDSSTEDYKIIRFYYSNNYVFDVVSLKKNSKRWRTIQQTPPISLIHPLYTLRDRSVEVDGFLHWQVEPSCSFGNMVFTFDLAQEKGRELILNVPNFNKDLKIVGLGVLDGCLCVTVNGGYNYVIWMMKDYGVAESWRPLIQLNFPPPLNCHGFHLLNYHGFHLFPICYTKKGRELLIQLNYKHGYIIFNLQDQSFQDHRYGRWTITALTAGFETLVSPKRLPSS